jgi:TPR repeat protein
MWRAALALLVALSLSGPAAAGPFEDGVAAYATGDYATAVSLWRPLAEQGHAEAQISLGVMYADGLGVPEDDAEAARWWRMAAEQGLTDAQYNLGFMYANGKGVPQDYVQAYMWLNLSVAPQTDPEKRAAIVWYRDLVAGLMTPEQIAEAQRLAREWGATE